MEDPGQQQPAASHLNQLGAPWLDEDYLQNASFEDYEAASYTFGAEAAPVEEIDVESFLAGDRGCAIAASPAHEVMSNSRQVLHSDLAVPRSLPFLIDGLDTPVRRRLFAHVRILMAVIIGDTSLPSTEEGARCDIKHRKRCLSLLHPRERAWSPCLRLLLTLPPITFSSPDRQPGSSRPQTWDTTPSWRHIFRRACTTSPYSSRSFV